MREVGLCNEEEMLV
ncbi:unnamed protein product [Knipowitschia caucasica]